MADVGGALHQGKLHKPLEGVVKPNASTHKYTDLESEHWLDVWGVEAVGCLSLPRGPPADGAGVGEARGGAPPGGGGGAVHLTCVRGAPTAPSTPCSVSCTPHTSLAAYPPPQGLCCACVVHTVHCCMIVPHSYVCQKHMHHNKR